MTYLFTLAVSTAPKDNNQSKSCKRRMRKKNKKHQELLAQELSEIAELETLEEQPTEMSPKESSESKSHMLPSLAAPRSCSWAGCEEEEEPSRPVTRSMSRRLSQMKRPAVEVLDEKPLKRSVSLAQIATSLFRGIAWPFVTLLSRAASELVPSPAGA
ncbi:hypothetical protein Ciccas_003067 [Cichlidogyrus casuarinus]|uniref:Uncharacterized protein n=1 Tax=Cichlidogyrus casuarinus TaxID=1844966 RepID=A0ABD2QFG3_9PLAT